jgi:hypothetical protein
MPKKSILTALLISFLASIAIAAPASAPQQTPFKNLNEIAHNISIATYAQTKSVRPVKIAILDNGFLGRDKEIGKTLPATTLYHAGPINVDAKTEEAHGTYMAQLVSGLLAKTPGVAYELHLYSAYGYSNLADAIKAVVAGKFDIVLYSQVWEYGGNGDSRGFINALVNQATNAGLIWINASGNFGDATYNAPVETIADDWAFLPSPNHGVRIRCYENPKKKCPLRAVLSWNDFKDVADVGTNKDLDLVLTDDTLKVIQTGGLQQVVSSPANGAPGTSLYPREIVEASLDPGLYELRVKNRSHNFTKAQDSLRIVTSGDYLEQLDTTDKNETLLAPADNPNVITIGATDSAKSSASTRMGKPEFSTPSEVLLKNGDTFKGSSNSAAMTAALAVIARAINPAANRADVIRFLNGQAISQPGVPAEPGDIQGTPLTLNQLGFGPTGPGCFRLAILPSPPEALHKILQSGAVTVHSTAGLKIMTPEDPFLMGVGVQRSSSDDMLVAGPKGFRVMSRSLQLMLPAGSYEVLQKPQDANYCQF